LFFFSIFKTENFDFSEQSVYFFFQCINQAFSFLDDC